MCQTRIGDSCSSQRKRLQIRQRLEMCQTRIGDFCFLQPKDFQIRQRLEMPQTSIGDLSGFSISFQFFYQSRRTLRKHIVAYPSTLFLFPDRIQSIIHNTLSLRRCLKFKITAKSKHYFSPTKTHISTSLELYPHSLSYQASTLTVLPSITLVISGTYVAL